MASFPQWLVKPTAEIPLDPQSGGFYGTHSFKIDPSQNVDNANGASSRFYEIWDLSTDYWIDVSNGIYGFEIQYVLDSGVVKNRLIVNSAGNNQPAYYSVNSTVYTTLDEFWIEEGDVVRGFTNTSSTVSFQFTCFPEMLYRSNGNDNESSIEFDVASNSIKYVVGGAFVSAINSGSSEGITIRRESFGGLVSLYWRSHVQGTQTIGYVTRDGYTGTWSIHHPSAAVFPYMLAGVIVGTAAEEAAANPPPDDDSPPDDDPPENDPPPTPVFVPRSARRGNLNFW